MQRCRGQARCVLRFPAEMNALPIRSRAFDPAPRVDHVALAPGSQVGRYEIEAVLGQGGFGITYRARDAQLGRMVAIKEYLPAALAVRQDGASVLPRSTEVAADFDWGRQRFVEEGRTLASLHDVASIVQVFDFLEENGTGYMVMALVQGETLEKRIAAAGSLGPREIDGIVWPLLDGLEKVHQAGFLHRDIKPANVLLDDDGRPILIDFGASRASLADRTATMTAIFTPGYAAAEQFSSARQGPWTDIYGMAATLYHAIAGTPPPSAVDRLLQDECVPLVQRSPEGFSRTLLSGIDAGLLLHAEARPQTIADWRRLLRTDVDETAPTVVMSTAGTRTVAKPVTRPVTRPVTGPVTTPTPPTPPSPPTELAVGARRGGLWKWLALASAVPILLAVGDYAFYAVRAPVAPVESTGAGPPPSPVVAAEPAALPPDAVVPPAPAVGPESQPGQAEEAALRLGVEDRRLVQRALTVQGFDTSGSDGALGPRSREMIAAWQRRHGHAATGYLTAGQHKDLLRDARPLLERADLERKAGTAGRPSAPGPAGASYGGSLSMSATSSGQAALPPVEAVVAIAGGSVTGNLLHPQCGVLPVRLAVDGSGAISGDIRIPEAVGCTLNKASATGRVEPGALSLDIRGVDVTLRGTLSVRGGQPQPAGTAPPAELRNVVP